MLPQITTPAHFPQGAPVLSPLAERFLRTIRVHQWQRINWRKGTARIVAPEIKKLLFRRARTHANFEKLHRVALWELRPEYRLWVERMKRANADIPLTLSVEIELEPLLIAQQEGSMDLVRSVTRLLEKCVRTYAGKGWLTEDYEQIAVGRRLFVHDCALQNLPKALRRKLLPNSMELDIENSQPTILNALTEGRYPHLAHYVAHRDEVLRRIQEECGVDREHAKQYILCTAFGAGRWQRRKSLGKPLPAWAEEGLVRDMAAASRELVQSGEGSALYTEAVRKHQRAGRRGKRAENRANLTVAAWILQGHELRCAQAALAWLRARGINVHVFLHDGLYAQKCSIDLDALNLYVQQMTGLPVRFACK